jgi:hypothetical protein
MFKQGQTLESNQDVTFKPLKGRRIVILKGQKFIVTNSQCNQLSNNLVQIGREGKAKIGQGYYLSFDLITKFFNVVN